MQAPIRTQQCGLIDAEAAEQQRMELRGIEQAAS